jgi:nucleoid DNA-binding protein
MNKGELVDQVADKAAVTKKVADTVLSAALEVVMEAVSTGDKVTLVGFGSFEPRQRQQREGRILGLAKRWIFRQPKYQPSRQVNCLRTKSRLLTNPKNPQQRLLPKRNRTFWINQTGLLMAATWSGQQA